MKKTIQLLKKNEGLLKYISLSYLDKAIVFIVPLLVLYLFNDKSIYITVEYIYSIVLILVPFLDIGLSGYFYYYYREEANKRKAIQDIFNVFFIIYLVLFAISVLLIAIHYFVFPFEDYIIYVASRCLFVVAFMFLSSYYRLINKPKKALYITMGSNIISLGVIVLYAVLGLKINLFIVFVGQILFCIYFFFKVIKKMIKKNRLKNKVLKNILKASIFFSWPTIIQVFLIMYVANFGKLMALDNLTVDETTLLALTQRYAMLTQLMHASIVAFIIKDIYLEKQKEINLNSFLKYLIFLVLSTVVVVFIVYLNWKFKEVNIDPQRAILVSGLIIGYTILWCIYSYLETFFSRENKNIIKLYLAILNSVVFALIIYFSTSQFLEKIAFAMILSIAVSLVASLIILKQRGYYFIK